MATDAIVKTAYSKRLVALPDCLEMPEADDGRIFDFKVGLDNKSSKFASRRLNDRYFKKSGRMKTMTVSLLTLCAII